jgi:hypothetical protein
MKQCDLCIKTSKLINILNLDRPVKYKKLLHYFSLNNLCKSCENTLYTFYEGNLLSFIDYCHSNDNRVYHEGINDTAKLRKEFGITEETHEDDRELFIERVMYYVIYLEALLNSPLKGVHRSNKLVREKKDNLVQDKKDSSRRSKTKKSMANVSATK